jgi:hypothetical protein
MRKSIAFGMDMLFETLFLQNQLAAIRIDAAIARSMGDCELEDSIHDEAAGWILAFESRAAHGSGYRGRA